MRKCNEQITRILRVCYSNFALCYFFFIVFGGFKSHWEFRYVAFNTWNATKVKYETKKRKKKKERKRHALKFILESLQTNEYSPKTSTQVKICRTGIKDIKNVKKKNTIKKKIDKIPHIRNCMSCAMAGLN